MIAALVVFLWFISGIAATWMMFAVDAEHGEPFDPDYVWFVLLGLLTLLLAIVVIGSDAKDATKAAGRRSGK